MELFLSLWRYIGEGFGLSIMFAFAAIFIFLVIRRFHSRKINLTIGAILLGATIVLIIAHGIPTQLAIPLSLRTFGPGDGPVLPVTNMLHFFTKFDKFERVPNIARDPAEVPATIEYAEEGVVEIEMTTKESLAKWQMASPSITGRLMGR